MPPIRTERQGQAALHTTNQTGLFLADHRGGHQINQTLSRVRRDLQSCAADFQIDLDADRRTRTSQGPRPSRDTYVDLTQHEDVPQICAAYCPTCPGSQHLKQLFKIPLAQCPGCSMTYLTRRFPCTCPQRDDPQRDEEEHNDAFADLRAKLDNHDPPLSNFAKRTMLLVAQVPPGLYTTYLALADFYHTKWGMMARTAFGGALKKNV